MIPFSIGRCSLNVKGWLLNVAFHPISGSRYSKFLGIRPISSQKTKVFEVAANCDELRRTRIPCLVGFINRKYSYLIVGDEIRRKAMK